MTRLARAAILAVIVVGCAQSRTAPTCRAEACVCDTDTCVCPDGSSCGWTTSSCSLPPFGHGPQQSCGLTCTGVSCVGTATIHVFAECTEGASCEVSVPAGGSADVRCEHSTCEATGADVNFECLDASTCHLRCEAPQVPGACAMSCAGTSTCFIMCPGDTEFRPSAGGPLYCP